MAVVASQRRAAVGKGFSSEPRIGSYLRRGAGLTALGAATSVCVCVCEGRTGERTEIKRGPPAPFPSLPSRQFLSGRGAADSEARG